MKSLLPFLFILIFAFPLQAQTGLQVGFNLGYNNVYIQNQNNYGYSELDYERTYGMNGGISFGFRLAENYGWQAEINLVRMGQDYFDLSKDFGPLDEEGKLIKVETFRFIDLTYLQVPVMFRYQTKRKKKKDDIISYHVMAGPCVGFLVGADQHYEADITDTKTIVALPNGQTLDPVIVDFEATAAVEEPKDYFSKIDFGGQIDFGVDIYIKQYIYITPSVRGYYGLTDINSVSSRELVDHKYQGASHNAYGGFNIGIHINLGEE